MLVRTALNYLTGYVRIKVEGFYIERFMNLCISKKILLMDIKREKSSIMYANVSIDNYRKLKEISKKTKSKIKILGKKGIPFIMHKYRKRKIFGIFMLMILIGILVLSNYVWNIEIEGNIKISKEEVMQSLEDIGLKVGIPKNNIDTNYIINKIRLTRDDIAWVGITIKGTNAIVKIKEIDKAPEIINENEYCNIVANKIGLITKIDVQNGTAAVQVGDIVKEGEILVNGYLEGKYTGLNYVHSIANIEAKVWYTKKEKQPMKQNIEEKTGNEEKKYKIKFKKNQINLFKTLSKFEKYDTICDNKKISLFSIFYLPIEIVKITNREYQIKEITYSEEELIQILTEKLKQTIEQEIQNKDNIMNVNINTNVEKGFVEVEVTYEVLEKIGTEQLINLN